MELFLVLCIVSVGLVLGQNDGRYRADSQPTRTPYVIGGRYRGANDGRYNAGNDGRYVPSDNGKYVHIAGKDGPGGGQYAGDGGQYTGGGGQYTGGGGQYTGGGGQYTGGGGKYSGNFGGQNSGGGKAAENSGYAPFKPTATKKPVNAVVTQKTYTAKAAPPTGWNTIRNEKTETVDGYHYLYETENGILAEESGKIENLGPSEDGLRSKGFYEYTGDDGVLYRVDYVADQNGFVPQGDHIPKMPPAIARLLQYLADHPSV